MRDTDENDGQDPDHSAVWQNINLQMIFQGVARSIVHIEYFSSGFPPPCSNDEPRIELMAKQIDRNVKQYQHDNAKAHQKSRKNLAHRWLPALLCRSKEITGKFVIAHR